MLGHKLGMVIKHGYASLNGFVDKVLIFGIAYHRYKGKRINCQRDQNEENTAEAKKPWNLLFISGESADHMDKEDQGKAGGSINAGPFCGNAKSHGNATEGKGNKNALCERTVRLCCIVPDDIFIHEIIHEQNKESGKNINGCDPGKVIVHAVKAEERGDCRCGKGIPEQPLGKQIHDTGNQDAKQSTHKTPAKGSHA